MTLSVHEPQDDLDELGELTPAEIETIDRNHWLLPREKATDAAFPSMTNLSAGFAYAGMIRPLIPEPPDYVAMAMPPDLATKGQVASWNMLWEAGQFRRRFFDEEDLPPQLAKIADLGDVNVVVVPRTRSRYFEYAPLVHLLPRDTAERFGLPLLKRGLWPFTTQIGSVDRYLPTNFESLLARAWASTVWPHLNPRSRQGDFSDREPIRTLAHNLDFWVPAVTEAIQDVLIEFPEVDNGRTAGPVTLIDGSTLPGAVSGNPRMGGPVWTGADEAAEMVAQTVEAADRTGRLRAIIDAVKSHRIEDDFSPAWSFAREDFERKLHHKRSKVQVKFVELTDTIPVQSADSQVVDRLVTNDFLTLLDPQHRQIVVLLASGYRQHEIAEHLGFANHSPVAKRLADIRRQAAAFFEVDDR